MVGDTSFKFAVKQDVVLEQQWLSMDSTQVRSFCV